MHDAPANAGREPMPTEGGLYPFTVIKTKGPLVLLFYPVRATPNGKLLGPSWIAGQDGSDFQDARGDIFSGDNDDGHGTRDDWHIHFRPLVGLVDKPHHMPKRPNEKALNAATRPFRDPDAFYWILAACGERELAASLAEEDMRDIVLQMETAYVAYVRQQRAA